ncbi:hypothetical protein [Runella slithyformis]|uniref:Uncharacterized protein n=1 Tax=Runella slithyformis (strain ATCC 29530 / DSM 19594 / LMG 11500 / NCIMB 11436 / LSU 4) TaxID=761193 RepID=A0A7U3ZMU5_RUNSL|nr:hypothetical protein [Runella slithyformis]AEI50121.1 hypothetical protein Runsl_3763 [Runella slithyformis DSM 19594]
MKYFIITLIYELKDVAEYPLFKNYIVNTIDKIPLAELFQSSKYQIEGYRVVGVLSPLAISKTTAESLKTLRKDTICGELCTIS